MPSCKRRLASVPKWKWIVRDSEWEVTALRMPMREPDGRETEETYPAEGEDSARDSAPNVGCRSGGHLRNDELNETLCIPGSAAIF
jgi:hypothetical protein